MNDQAEQTHKPKKKAKEKVLIKEKITLRIKVHDNDEIEQTSSKRWAS